MAPVVLAVDDEVVVAAHPVHLLHVQVDVVPLDGAVFATMIIDSQNLFDYIQGCVKSSPESAAVGLRLRVNLDVLVPRHLGFEDFLAEWALESALRVVNMDVMDVLKKRNFHWNLSRQMYHLKDSP